MTRRQKASAGVAAAVVAATAYLVTPPPAPTAPITYATVRWIVRSNGVVISGVPSVVFASEDLQTWHRQTTNSDGIARIQHNGPQLFFKVEPL